MVGRLKVNFSRIFRVVWQWTKFLSFPSLFEKFLARWIFIGRYPVMTSVRLEIAMRFNAQKTYWRNVNYPRFSFITGTKGLSDVSLRRSSAINIRLIACNVSEAINLLLLHSLTQLIWCTQSTVQAPINSLSLAVLTEWNGLLTWYRRANARLISLRQAASNNFWKDESWRKVRVSFVNYSRNGRGKSKENSAPRGESCDLPHKWMNVLENQFVVTNILQISN